MTRRRPDCGALRVIEPASMLDGAEGNAGRIAGQILAAYEIARQGPAAERRAG
jgi:hypothetical protein